VAQAGGGARGAADHGRFGALGVLSVGLFATIVLILVVHSWLALSPQWDTASWGPWLAGALGVTATLALTALVAVLAGSRRRAMSDAGEEHRLRRETEATLESLLAQSSAMLWTTDRAGIVTAVSGAHLSGSDVGRPVSALLGRTDPVDALGEATSTALSGSAATADVRSHGLSLHAKVEPRRDDSGAVVGTVGMCLDVTERESAAAALDAAQHELAESEARFRRLAENALDIVYRVRVWPEITFEYVSPSSEEVTGWKPEELYADRSLVEEMFDIPSTLALERWGLPDEGGSARLPLRHRDGTLRWIDNRATPTYDSEGRLVILEGIARDVTDTKEAEDRLSHQATHDALTDLPNRMLLNDRIDQALARSRRSGRSVAVLFLDIDHFKEVNDDRGHEAGDRLLAAVAARLRHALRPGDTVARLGGDEFVLCCDDVSTAEEARTIAARVRDALGHHFAVDGEHSHGGANLRISASIGIALSRPDDTPQSLLRSADLAMYRAKQAGRDRAALHGDERHGTSGREGTLAALAQAMANGELRLYWQPQFALTSSIVVEMEALLRWQHPTRGVVAAGAFLDLAREAGILADVGAWAIRAACAQGARWGDHGPVVSVNVAREQVLRGDLPEIVCSALRDWDLRPERLRLEFSERVLVDAETEVQRCLSELRALGVGLGIDDYGTAATTRSVLARLPLDTMKIDRSLVMRLGHDTASEAVVGAAVKLAHTLGLRAVAEGVESEVQLEMLRLAGCDAVQGHLFARPQPAENMGQLVGAAVV